MHIRLLPFQTPIQHLPLTQYRSVQRQRTVHGSRPRSFAFNDHALSFDRSDDPRPFIRLVRLREVSRVVFWREAGGGWKRPDLEEVDLFGAVCFFGVRDPSAGGGHLEVAAFENLGVAHGVFAGDVDVMKMSGSEIQRDDVLFEFTGDDIGKDLEFTMGMSTEPCPRSDAILVDDAKGTKKFVFTVLIPERNDYK